MKYRVTNVREVAQLIETLKQKVQAKAQTIIRYNKRETQYSQNKMFKEDTKKFYRNLGMKNTEASFTRFLHHTQLHTTVRRTPLEE